MFGFVVQDGLLLPSGFGIPEKLEVKLLPSKNNVVTDLCCPEVSVKSYFSLAELPFPKPLQTVGLPQEAELGLSGTVPGFSSEGQQLSFLSAILPYALGKGFCWHCHGQRAGVGVHKVSAGPGFGLPCATAWPPLSHTRNCAVSQTPGTDDVVWIENNLPNPGT